MKLKEELYNFILNKTFNVSHVELSKSYGKISSSYMNNSGNGVKLLSDYNDYLAYLVARLPATYSAVSKVMDWVREVIDVDNIKSLVDVGGGMGTATIVAKNYLKNLERSTIIEWDKSMISLGEEAFEYLKESNYQFLQGNIVNYNLPNSDLIVESYCLNELTDTNRLLVAKEMFNKSNDYVLFVETGTPRGYEILQEIKSQLVSMGGNVLAPCPNNEPCKLKDDWCQFNVRVERSKIHREIKNSQAPFEDEKFTYLLISKKEKSKELERVIRHPNILPKKVTVKTCSKDGIAIKTITKRDKEIYKLARSIQSGDILK